MLSRLSPLVALAALVLAAPAPAQDSAPQLISRTGGAGTWSNTAELRRAAEAGNTRACAEYGDRLVSGDEAPRDVARGLEFLERAARGGSGPAAFRIGYMLENGNGVGQDHARALGYFKAAAVAGVSEAYYNVGAAYASGRGAKRDFVEALAWMIVGRDHHAPGDGESRVRAYLQSEKREDWITAAEARAPKLATELETHDMSFFLPPAGRFDLGIFSGAAAKSSPQTGAAPAFKPGDVVALPPLPDWRLEPPRHGDTPAPDGAPVSVVSIFGPKLEWPSVEALTAAAHHDDPSALFAFGQLLIDGEQLPADVDRGLMLLERGAALGSVDAAYRLADVYIHGRIAPMDEKRGFAYMLMAARGGARTAMFNTAALYANGRGTKRDYTESLAWFLVAAHYGADMGGAAQIRGFLSRNAPDQIPLAQHRADQLIETVEAAHKQQG